jgi:hypothetical protein
VPTAGQANSPLQLWEYSAIAAWGDGLLAVGAGTDWQIRVWLSDDGLKDIGCTAAVAQVLERMDDGRMNILVRGGTPFRRAIEEGLIDPTRMLQVGLRGQVYSEEDFDFARSKGIEYLFTEDIFEHGVPWVIERFQRLQGSPCYLTFDIDVVDPDFHGSVDSSAAAARASFGLPRSRRNCTIVRLVSGGRFCPSLNFVRTRSTVRRTAASCRSAPR